MSFCFILRLFKIIVITVTTCRNNTDCQDGKYCMAIHESTLRVCVDPKDAMRIYRDAGKLNEMYNSKDKFKDNTYL